MREEAMDTSEVVYPVLFTLHEVVSGNGFLAGVAVEGRGSLVHEEDEGWWLYGVEPGGLAENGDSPQEAHLKFVEDFRKVLFDVASDAPSFDDFESEVVRILCQLNEPEAERWERAVKAIRAGEIALDDPFLAALPKWKAKAKCRIVVRRLDEAAARYKPSDNKPNILALPVAA